MLCGCSWKNGGTSAPLVLSKALHHQSFSCPFQRTTPPVLLLPFPAHYTTSPPLVLSRALQHQSFPRPFPSTAAQVLLSSFPEHCGISPSLVPCKASPHHSFSRPHHTHEATIFLSSSRQDESQKASNFETSKFYFSAAVKATDNPIAP